MSFPACKNLEVSLIFVSYALREKQDPRVGSFLTFKHSINLKIIANNAAAYLRGISDKEKKSFTKLLPC
jgi:hypothetical protein